MKNKKYKFITFIINILMAIIFLITVYFCLDVFKIIEIPQKYSIASLFYSQIEIMATAGENITDNVIIPENIIQNIFPTNKEKNNPNEEAVSTSAEDILNGLNNNNNNYNNSEILNVELLENRFYYNQLDENAKIIYDELYKNIDNLKTGNYTVNFDTKFNDLLHQENGKDLLANSFQLAINSLTFDNPELFYLDITKINLITEIITRAFSKTYKVSIGGNGNSYLVEQFNNLDTINNVVNNINDIKKDIIDNANNETDIVKKIKVVHDYLVDTIDYDLNYGRNVYNVYGAFIDRKAVCEGYARAFKSILDEIEIPCIIVCGVGRNKQGLTESHAWNYVKINENWYAIDVTWDDPVISGFGRITEDIKYAYFLKGSDEFFADHYEDGKIVGDFDFRYPTISEYKY